LNELAGRERFANLGLDGSHPAALAGLVEYYGKPIALKDVLVQCNPLWMSSPKHDLEEQEEFPFNHPALVPQFFPTIPCYKADYSKRLGHVIDRQVEFSAWTDHLQQAYFDRMNIPAWTLEHPYNNPLAQLSRDLPPSDNTLRHQPISWTARGIKPQNFPWVDLNHSLQWHSFQRAVEILQQRGNRVFVLVGPFNEPMLKEPSRQKYEAIKETIAKWLQEKGVAHAVPSALPSDDYADASHPLAVGYARLARELEKKEFFN
jgi:hypothetical protein